MHCRRKGASVDSVAAATGAAGLPPPPPPLPPPSADADAAGKIPSVDAAAAAGFVRRDVWVGEAAAAAPNSSLGLLFAVFFCPFFPCVRYIFPVSCIHFPTSLTSSSLVVFSFWSAPTDGASTDAIHVRS